MYYGVSAHEECGLPVSTLGITQGGIHSEGVHTIYAQGTASIGQPLKPACGGTRLSPMESPQ